MTAEATEAYIACMRGNWPDALILHSGRAPLLIDIPSELTEQLLHLSNAFPLSGLIEPKLEDATPTFLKIAGFSFRELPIFHMTEAKIDDVSTLRLYLRELPSRVRWGLSKLRSQHAIAQIELHPWRKIEPELEFRCFIREGKLVGISQYDADSYFAEVVAQASSLEEALRSFVAGFIDDLHIDTCAADICFLRTPAGMSARLMELNPLVGSTDKCLFSGLPDSYLDGRFLYRHFAPD